MGCAQSTEDADGAVGRSRERKQLLRAAVAARNGLAAAHAGHAKALKNVGAALSDYASGEAHDGLLHAASTALPVKAHAALPPPPIDEVLPPPPPGEVTPAGPLLRSMSAPDLPLPAAKKRPSGDASEAIIEEDDAEGRDADGEGESAPAAALHREEDTPAPPPPPPPLERPPPPTRSPPPVPPETEHKAAGVTYEFIFGSQEPMPPPTLESDAAEPSLVAETRDATPPLQARSEPQPPPAIVEEAADSKKAEEAGLRRAAVQKAARKAEGKKGRMVVFAPAQAASLVMILHQLDDQFLKASESAHEVSKMLEAARLHYHSNFAETRGFVDHSARVMQAITWNRSFKGLPQPENVNNQLDGDEWETHATILDKLLAWEKKLCHEVKEFEVIKMEYQQKLAVLNKKKQRGVGPASLEKTKSVVSHLHTKYVVDLQTMESTVAEINRVRDEQLYPKLLELVKGMGKMWEAMHKHHGVQLRIITELKSFDISVATRETSEQHHERTAQLWGIVQEWHLQFDKFMSYQKEYIENLYSWLKLNVIPIDTNLKGNPNSAQPLGTVPPIKRLLYAWHDFLGKLPDEAAKRAIHRFSEVIHTIILHQDDELKLSVKCEETRRDLERKRRQFESWAQKYMDKRVGILPEDNNPDGMNPDMLVERKATVDKLEIAAKDLEEKYRVQCTVVREKSLSILRTSLPELFRAVSDFSFQSAAMFKDLWSIVHSSDQLDE